jgi:hypothetical protein
LSLPARRALGALFACALLGCVHGSAPREQDPFRTGLWPLYTADTRPWAGVSEARFAGPFAERSSDDDGSGWALRPLLSGRSSPEELGWDLLFPLVASRSAGGRDTAWLFLLASLSRDRERSGSVVGPAFWGRTPDQRRYGGLFPLLGRFRERLGMDRIDFVLWPLFARAQRGDYREIQVLWPIFAWGRGDGRSKLRVWPLFGIDRREGVYERRFALWPLLHRRTERMDTRYPVDATYVLPFYGRRDSGSWRSRFWLFPLLGHQRDLAKPGAGRIDVLWPLFVRSNDGRGGERLALRPFWARRRTPAGSRESVLLGLWGRSSQSGPDLEEQWQHWLWAGRIGRRREAGVETRRMDLWPFIRLGNVEGPDGVAEGFARVPYLLPLRGLEPDLWHLHYGRLLEVYALRWRGGELRSSLLWGLREERRAPGVRWVSWGGWLHRSSVRPIPVAHGEPSPNGAQASSGEGG